MLRAKLKHDHKVNSRLNTCAKRGCQTGSRLGRQLSHSIDSQGRQGSLILLVRGARALVGVAVRCCFCGMMASIRIDHLKNEGLDSVSLPQPAESISAEIRAASALDIKLERRSPLWLECGCARADLADP